jgi:hypothetical protein
MNDLKQGSSSLNVNEVHDSGLMYTEQSWLRDEVPDMIAISYHALLSCLMWRMQF